MVVPDEVVDQELPRPLLDNAAGSVAWRYTREPVREEVPDQSCMTSTLGGS